MNIVYLKSLQQNPVEYGDGWDTTIIPVSLQDIGQLELLYNSGNPFPIALKELLYLAGADCYVLDYGLNDTQQELQEYVRGRMQETGRSISRPFYVIDIYNAGGQFLFVYLDEGDNPVVYEGHYYDNVHFSSWIRQIMPSLSDLIDHRVERVLKGRNPF